ncbi:AAA family ATPase [Paracoccaceae bacterium]|nr:AAA family ATPase [Paracoccaceae bacterium]
MKLEYMRLENWRSFYGENSIEFSTDKERNVTLIRAENGVGKTSLLAALNWCLFGILDKDEFENPNELVNDFAIQNDKIHTTKIEVEFSHNDETYKAARTFDQNTKQTGGIKVVTLQNGAEIPLGPSKDPDRLIESIIPKEMAPHFFFYGEKTTSNYTGIEGSRQFGKAVKSILGSTVANLAIGDLKKVYDEYAKQAAQNTNSEAVQLQEKIRQIKEDIIKQENNLLNQEKEEHEADKLIENLNRQLAGTQQIKEDQNRRASLELRLAKLVKAEDAQKTKSRGWIGKFGIPLLINDCGEEITKLLEQQETKKKIPGPYNENFVTGLLEDQMCVCGRPLNHGSMEEEKVKSLLKDASDETVVTRVIATTKTLGILNGKSSGAWEEHTNNGENLKNLVDEIAEVGSDLEEISEKLQNNEVTEIAEKEGALIRAKDKRKQAHSQQTGISVRINLLKRDQSDLEKREQELLSKSENAKRYVKRTQFTKDIIQRLSDRLEDEENYAKIMIKKRLDEIIKEFMRKNLTAVINKDYQLTLLDENKKPASKSTGENQLLGLAFTGAIAYFAKDREHEDSDILLSGTEAPLVIDSPFGHLDTTYRRGVSNFLPKLASQIILLVSSSQASSEVLEELGNKIGLQYYLERNEQDEAGDRQEENVKINGKSYDLTLYNQEITGTLIKEVENG